MVPMAFNVPDIERWLRQNLLPSHSSELYQHRDFERHRILRSEHTTQQQPAVFNLPQLTIHAKPSVLNFSSGLFSITSTINPRNPPPVPLPSPIPFQTSTSTSTYLLHHPSQTLPSESLGPPKPQNPPLPKRSPIFGHSPHLISLARQTFARTHDEPLGGPHTKANVLSGKPHLIGFLRSFRQWRCGREFGYLLLLGGRTAPRYR